MVIFVGGWYWWLNMSPLMTKPTKWLCGKRRLRSGWHPPSLIRVFAVRMQKACVLSYPFSAKRRLWSRLIWVSPGRTVILLVLSRGGSIILMPGLDLSKKRKKKKKKKKKDGVSNNNDYYYCCWHYRVVAAAAHTVDQAQRKVTRAVTIADIYIYESSLSDIL